MSAIARRSEARQTSEISTLSAVTPEGLDSHLRSHSELGSPDADSARVLLHLSRSLPQLSSLFPPLEDADSWPDKPTRPPPRRPRRSSSLVLTAPCATESRFHQSRSSRRTRMRYPDMLQAHPFAEIQSTIALFVWLAC